MQIDDRLIINSVAVHFKSEIIYNFANNFQCRRRRLNRDFPQTLECLNLFFLFPFIANDKCVRVDKCLNDLISSKDYLTHVRQSCDGANMKYQRRVSIGFFFQLFECEIM